MKTQALSAVLLCFLQDEKIRNKNIKYFIIGFKYFEYLRNQMYDNTNDNLKKKKKY